MNPSDDASFRVPARCFHADAPEALDRADVSEADLRRELGALATANRWLGGYRLTLNYVKQLIGPAPSRPVTLLDLGTGGADFPRTIAAWARRQRLSLAITAVDSNPKTVQLARELCRGWPEISIEQQDILNLPHADRSFDLVLCSAVLHHFDGPEAVAVLRNIGRIASSGYIVTDLRRNWLAIQAARWMPSFGSPLFRQDAVQSCRAAFTVEELRAMAQQAGLADFQIRRHQGVFRMVLAGKR